MTQVIEALVQILISSGVIWAATMAFKGIFRKKLSPKAHVAIWAVLIARLLIPVTFDTGVHLIQLPVPEAQTAEPAEEEMKQPARSIPGTVYVSHGDSTAEISDSSADVPHREVSDSMEPAAAARIHWDAPPEEIALSVWILGMLVSVAISVRAYSQLKRDIESRMCTGADPLHLLFQECMSELGIKDRVFLAVQSELAGPALMFPNIVLLSEEMQHQPKEAIRMALRHELTHFARKDQARALLLSVLRTVWWFNPFVWLAVRQIREDLETACDSDVVSRLGRGGKEAYAKTVLSMFGRTETNQAVLGMAFGGAKKNAERRIRGIYMVSKSKKSTKACAILLSGVLGLACFTTACQPTPAAEAVVNQKDGIPDEALIGDSQTPDPEATTAPAAKYEADGRWTETIEKSDKFIINADTDIMMPDVDVYPVEKLAPRELSIELVKELVDTFAPGVEFHKLNTLKTKAEWEEQIQQMQEMIAEERANGLDAEAETDEETLSEWLEMYENAPEGADRTVVPVEFDYETDYTGEVLKDDGPIYLNLEADAPDGGRIMISARQKSPRDPMMFPYFMYTSASYTYEELDRDNASRLEDDKKYADALEEPYRSEELEHFENMRQEAQAHLAMYDNNTIDLAEARRQGEALLERMSIRGVQIFTAMKALIGPYHTDMDATLAGSAGTLTQPGVYMEFNRENGGIPCVSISSANGIPDVGAKQYSAPFIPERGIIVMDQDYNVRVFEWSSPTEPVEIVAPDSKLIPLDEAKERLTEELYREELAVSAGYIDKFGLAYDITEMKLVMGFTDVQGEPENALAVPAWYMKAQGRQLEPEEGTGETVLYNLTELMVSALDGSPILIPGIIQAYNVEGEEGNPLQ